MPEIADFVSKLREAFGDATIDEAVARGKRPESRPFSRRKSAARAARNLLTIQSLGGRHIVRDRHYCKGCDGSCFGTAVRCNQRR
jgi:hypothetical protein